jgi:acetoin utilization protein AcuB
MLVKQYMTRHPVMVEPKSKVVDARRLMAKSGIRHLPVVGDGKKLEGMLTWEGTQLSYDQFSSLNVWEINEYLSNLTVERCMAKGADLLQIGPDATLEEAADLLIAHKDSGMAVVEDGVVVGVLTETDMLVELKNLLGANEDGFRVTMRVPDQRGEFSRLTGTLAERGWGIMSLGSARDPRSEAHWDIVIKVRGCEFSELEPVLRGIEGQELLDIRETSAQ